MANFCTGCGASLDDAQRFCTECGAPQQSAPEAPAPEFDEEPAYQQPEPEPRYSRPAPQARQQSYDYQQEERSSRRASKAPSPNSPYAPITTWGFVGTMLLMSIPVVGLILAIIWAYGGCRKINKRNLSRAFLIMMAFALVFSLIAGLVIRGITKKAMEEAGVSAELMEEGLGGLGALAAFGSMAEGGNDASGDGSDAGGLLGSLGALAGMGSTASGSGELDELGQLADIMEGLEALTGEESGGQELGDLIDNIEEQNAQFDAKHDGWPSSLRPYPGGTASSVASYRTEISGTSEEEMMGWINDLKGDGFKFQDFYDFGMSEDDMLSMNAWWATDGKIYLSVSYYDGLVTIDHTNELPDLESYFN
ncbi:MAG: zinc-ribbon domain-containing protein [Clostridia bacterium]|nr:zinc-ribbon domain-containing protein [Clostridia bacterium]